MSGAARSVDHTLHLALLPRDHRHHEPVVANRDELFLQGSIVVIWRVNDDSDGLVDQVFGSAMEDPGRLCADLPGRDRVAIARRVLTFLDGDGFGSSGALIQYLSEALGSEGRAEVRETTGEIGRL